MQFKMLDKLILRSLNIPGYVTTGKTVAFFIKQHPKGVIEVTGGDDNHFLVTLEDILYAYDVETKLLKYQRNMDRAL